jgi:hypothetical protein
MAVAVEGLYDNEVIPPGEAAAMEVVRNVVFALMDAKTRPVQRVEHPKAAGVVRAAFEVLPNLPPELRHGVFRESRVYPALVRYSNAAMTNDSQKDTHGMAVKLFDVPGDKILPDERHATTQDFLLVDSPMFFIRNAPDYAVFAPKLQRAVALSKGPFVQHLPAAFGQLVQFGYLLFAYLLTHPHEARLLMALRKKPPKSSLDTSYYSSTPYRLGPHAVHWIAKPQAINAPPPLVHFDDPALRERANCLRAALVSQLRQEDAAFDFYAQLQTDPETMPIEDPTVTWDESASPPVKVGTLRIPAQEFDTPEKRELGLRLSFDPWHSLPEHQPLGGINRTRRVVYVAISDKRRELNQVPIGEPDLEWLRRHWDNVT